MVTDEVMVETLMARYESKEMGSKLDKDRFKEMFKDAVKDYFPSFLKEECEGQSLYGISFEVTTIVQKVFAENFFTLLYFNTEEMYEENIEDCEEDEKAYYRFEPWSEWDEVRPETPLFEKIQNYLKQNSLNAPLDISKYAASISEEAAEWYEENEGDFEEAFEEECEQVRMWIAEVLGELRKESFWEEQGNADIYVIPFRGEDDIDYEEMVKTFREMDQNCHDTEYLDYLKEMEEEND